MKIKHGNTWIAPLLNTTDAETDDAAIKRPFVSLPKTDKLTIKRTGNYRIQVSLATKYDKEDNIAVYVRAVVCGDDCAVPTDA